MRYAACNALGQLANDFAPTLQMKYHEKVKMFLFCTPEQVKQVLIVHVDENLFRQLDKSLDYLSVVYYMHSSCS